MTSTTINDRIRMVSSSSANYMIRMNDTIVTISLFTFHMLRIRYIYRHRIMKKGDGMRTMVQGSF